MAMGLLTIKNGFKKIINFAARVISGRRKFDHISDVLKELGLLSANELVTYHTLTLVHGVLRHGEPEALARLFRRRGELRDRRTRQDDALQTPRCRTTYGQRQFAFRAAQL